jgi:hypothetical protein
MYRYIKSPIFIMDDIKTIPERIILKIQFIITILTYTKNFTAIQILA